jgi:hypothetical protein
VSCTLAYAMGIGSARIPSLAYESGMKWGEVVGCGERWGMNEKRGRLGYIERPLMLLFRICRGILELVYDFFWNVAEPLCPCIVFWCPVGFDVIVIELWVGTSEVEHHVFVSR